MPKHTPGARLHRLMKYVGWEGDSAEFAELVPRVIERYSDPKLKEAMLRFYGPDRGTQVVDPVTGRPDSTDSRFYQQLEKGRVIFKTILSFTPEEYDMLKSARSKVAYG
jgi:hypothetical protein